MKSQLNWNNRTVLVTGAEGFIGSTLVDLLVELGANVRAFVHYKPYAEKGNLAHLMSHPSVETIAGDVRDAGRVSDAVAGCDTVFHLAALIGIPYSYDSPGAYVQTNVVGTENIAEACRRHSVQRLVHTSTSEVYGTALTVPIDESHPLQPQSPYSASKIGADMTALSHRHAFDLPVTVVRPFNTYGPRQSARAVIPTILAQLHAGAREIKLGSLTPTRDFTYVTDTARGFLAVAECDRALGAVVNLGSGREISIGDLAQALITASGREASVVVDPARLRPSGSEVERLLSDNSRAREWAGWQPETPLGEGLKSTSKWVAENLALFAPGRYQI
ncbi:SDR family NAD(P)-dependent oxidoreductase [Streptomyces sp. NBC_00825]|uniref:GDP-mannose 4,6-dehydratase n=1 Tax=unclassified Streptomyces TaxID=2593676 RepID=UPI002250BF47|nr:MULTISPECIES: GDP-mannose 4,6-dehydratase [unclassified Streptomyces]WTB51879.1 SDR family NAD(P)-dependent oxidoreductase [Streptomyces sp. NBC_00826]WTH95229.1 SDR family NAD(P)-dependent oxidoreductase [Streptomyces sp. NBC_00825]WTI03963.1 SDR family NAD(P)-dependent oxidoreductase [Streptomyces sp. NBC_00822]MCX4869554.1 SDR family NAD(P)-dependent oxidoreductase [Streptomyces sp. NBC_00906]MCX4900793.1 SDR family NAD(P)-dependent oxidoreductase [Streptomyces sp. NBC_00892]